MAIDLAINDASAGEDAGNLVFPVVLSEASGTALTVEWATADGAALDPGDYTAAGGTITFGIGETSKLLSVAIINDALDEDNESFYVNLSNASAGTITDGQAVGTITDNDDAPTLAIDDLTVTESDVSGTSDAVFTVTLSAASSKTITVSYATANGTAATSASDYSSASDTLTFAPGDTTQQISVTVLGDTAKESDETFKINLSSLVNATLSDSQGLGTIADNDATGQTNLYVSGTGEIHQGHVDANYTLPDGTRLLYSTRGDAWPIIVVETVQPQDSAVPELIKADFTFNGSALSPVYYDTTGLSAGDPLRFVFQADASSLASGLYNWSLKLTETHGSEISTRYFADSKLLVNRHASPFGNLWWLDGLDQLAVEANAATVLFADGATARFTKSAGVYSGPSWQVTTLVENAGGTFTLTDKHQNKATFNSSGLLTQREDRNGNKTTYTYSSGLLASIEDPFGRTTTFTYTSGLLSQIEDFAGRVTVIAHTGTQVASITAPDPDGAGSLAAPITDFAYHATTGLLVQVDDPLDHATAYAYDFARRLSTRTLADGGVQDFSPVMVQGLIDPSGGQGTLANPAPLAAPADAVGDFTDPLDHRTQYTTDRYGLPLTIRDADQNLTTFARNIAGQVTSVTRPDPDGNGPLGQQVTAYAYDTSYNLTTVTFADQTTQSWTYDSTFNLPDSFTDELSRATSFTLDTQTGNTLDVTRDDRTTAYTYTPKPAAAGDLPGGLLLSITDALGRLTELGYEQDDQSADFGRLISITYASGTSDEAEYQFEYDAWGNVSATIDPLDRRTEQQFDALNRLTLLTLPDPDGAAGQTAPEYAYQHDAAGNVTLIVDPLGTRTRFEYDEMNRLALRSDDDPVSGPAQFVTSYGRDAAGQLTTITDPLSHVTTLAYDALGRRTSVTLPDPDGAGQPRRARLCHGLRSGGQRRLPDRSPGQRRHAGVRHSQSADQKNAPRSRRRRLANQPGNPVRLRRRQPTHEHHQSPGRRHGLRLQRHGLAHRRHPAGSGRDGRRGPAPDRLRS